MQSCPQLGTQPTALSSPLSVLRSLTLLLAVSCAGTLGASSSARAATLGAPPFAAIQPVLRLGNSGLPVADWQQVLNEWLGSVAASSSPRRADVLLRRRLGGRLRVDGVFGPATLAATKQWQKDAYIRPDGIVSWRTWLTWIGSGVTCCGAGYPNFSERITAYRAPIPAVGWWQVALNGWLHLQPAEPIVITGLYDAPRG